MLTCVNLFLLLFKVPGFWEQVIDLDIVVEDEAHRERVKVSLDAAGGHNVSCIALQKMGNKVTYVPLRRFQNGKILVEIEI